MDKDKINIINKIDNFRYIRRHWTYIKGKEFLLHEENKELAHYKSDNLLIFYSNEGEYIELNISYNYNKTKIIQLFWENFSMNEIKMFSNLFNIKYDEDSQYPSISLKIGDSCLIAKMAIANSSISDHYFITVFCFEDGDSRKNSRLYVHGIWEVELSDEFKNKIGL
jgi:hypothetical protein